MIVPETKTQAKRRERNAVILARYKEFMAIKGVIKTGAVSAVAEELGVSISLVNRVIKES